MAIRLQMPVKKCAACRKKHLFFDFYENQTKDKSYSYSGKCVNTGICVYIKGEVEVKGGPCCE